VSATARSLAKLAMLAAGLVAGGFLLRALGAAPGTDWVDAYVRDDGVRGEVVFILAAALATGVGVPRQSAAFLGGYAFGTVAGTGLALLAQLLGCALGFLWARAVGRGWAERRLNGRFGPRLRPLVETLRQNPFSSALALRLLPVGNNLALNLLAGLSGIALWPFLAASALGYLPQTIIFALLGKGVRVDGTWQMVLAAALLLVSVGLGLWLLRRQRAGV
jgi:uncharacterized membrane protein YdjX (TVP38/TMEM64 family)